MGCTPLNGLIYFKDITLGSSTNQNIGGSFDLKTGRAYTIEGGGKNSADIDMVLMRSSVNAMNLMAPANGSFSAWSSGKPVLDWSVRHDGNFIKLTNPSAAEEEMFDTVTTVDGLIISYNGTLAHIDQRPGYNSSYDGPSNRIKSIQPGDIIFYYSDDRSVVAIMKVGDVDPSAKGSIQLQIKAGTFNPDILLNTGVVPVGGWSSLGAYGKTFQVDLANLEAHDTSYSNHHQGEIDMLNLYSGSGFVNFMTPTSGAVTSWGGSKNIANWSTRNDGTFIRFDNPTSTEDNTFETLVTRSQLVQAYNDAEANVANRPGYTSSDNGPSIRVRHLAEGDIIYFKSNMPNRDLYAAIKVLKITLVSGHNGRESIDILVKSNLQP